MENKNSPKEVFKGIVILLLFLFLVLFLLEAALRLIFRDGYFGYRPIESTHSTSEFVYHINKNSWGVRDREFSEKELKEKTVLLFMGDSMTFGQGLEVENTFPKLLEKELNTSSDKFIVINGGGRGTGTNTQFESVRELMGRYRFDTVCFVFYLGNDSDNNLESVQAGFPDAVLSKKENKSISKWFFSNSVLFNLVYYRSKLAMYKLGLIKVCQGKELLKKQYSKRGEEGWAATSEVIGRIYDFFRVNGTTKLFFVFMPEDIQVDPAKIKNYGLNSQDYDLRKPNQILKEILEAKGVVYIDLTDAFSAWYLNNPGSVLYFQIDRHLNESGHKLTAQIIYNFLLSNKSFICR